jgi:hypothetical protein
MYCRFIPLTEGHIGWARNISESGAIGIGVSRPSFLHIPREMMDPPLVSKPKHVFTEAQDKFLMNGLESWFTYKNGIERMKQGGWQEILTVFNFKFTTLVADSEKLRNRRKLLKLPKEESKKKRKGSKTKLSASSLV